jgi:hypothetical protein
MYRVQSRVLVSLVSFAFIGSGLSLMVTPVQAQEQPSNALVYHQLTNRTVGTTSLGTPVIRPDGKLAVYAESGGDPDDPNLPNRIFYIDTASGDIFMIDSYQPLCHCLSWVDIGNRGIVWTDTVQIRVHDGAVGKTLLKLDSNEISSIRLTEDGSQIFFTLRRDATMDGGKTRLPRGVYAIRYSGGAPRQIVGVEAIAKLLNFSMANMPIVLHNNFDQNLLDVSADGSRVVFGASAGGGEYVLTVSGKGGTPELIAGPYDFITHVAISGDGTTLAWGMTRGQSYDLGDLRNDKETELLDINNETYQPLQLSADGKRLLVGTDGSLYDTDTMVKRPLASVDPINGGYSALLRMGMDRTSMNGDGTRFLYVFIQPQFSALEQLGTVIVGPDPEGDQALVTDAWVEPREILLDDVTSTTEVRIRLVWNGELTSVGLLPLYLGEHDPNISVGPFVDLDGNDPKRGEGIFNNAGIFHARNVLRDDDTGPRTMRVYAETKSDDGRYHGTAVDFGTLAVVVRD